MIKIIEATRKFAYEEFKKYYPNDLEFSFLQNEYGIQLAKSLNADTKIVEIGCFLMDIKIGQAVQEKRISEHVKMSSDATKEFLKQFKMEEEIKEKIINCVEAHHKQVPFICKEAEICANSDGYKFLYPRGVLLYHKMLVKRDLSFDEVLNQLIKKMDDKWALLTLNETREDVKESYKTFKKMFEEARK